MVNLLKDGVPREDQLATFKYHKWNLPHCLHLLLGSNSSLDRNVINIGKCILPLIQLNLVKQLIR